MARPATVAFALGVLVLAVVGGVAAISGMQGPSDARFREVGGAHGFNYTATNIPSPTGPAGVYVVDANRDERPDLLVLGGSARRGEFGATLGSHPALYVNVGDGFERRERFPGEELGQGTVESALVFDHDNDGWQDVLLLPRGREPVFLENVDGEFERRDAGFDVELSVPVGVTTADYDGDGCLDVFVIQNGDWTDRSPEGMSRAAGGTLTVRDDNGNPNLLFRGNCSSFVEVTDEAGIEGERWSLATSFLDLTGDGRPDIHVANDYNNDYLYVNEGDGTFEQVRLGEETNRNGMSSEVFDVDRDGRPDVLVTNIYFDLDAMDEATARSKRMRIGAERVRGNNLLINRGNGTFVDRAGRYGVRKGGWGWAASAADFDNDGAVEIYQNTERLQPYHDGTENTSYYAYPIYWERSGAGFERQSPAAIGFEKGDTRGAARLDMDRDGDLDLVVAPYTFDNYRLYENEGTRYNWFEVRVESLPDQTAIGAEVTVTANGRTRTKVKTARSGFQSQETRVIHFGLGTGGEIDRLRVVWPDGTERVYEDLDANRRVVVGADGLRSVGDGQRSLAERLLAAVQRLVPDL